MTGGQRVSDQPLAPAQIAAHLRSLKLAGGARITRVADPGTPATWALSACNNPAFTDDFIRDQQLVWQGKVSARPKNKLALEKFLAVKGEREVPDATDLWLAATRFASVGDRLRTAQRMLGWSQTVHALEAGQEGTSQLSLFMSNKIKSIGFLNLACRSIKIDSDWVEHDDQTKKPDWIIPWQQATIEAHDLCDQFVQQSDMSHITIKRDNDPAQVFLHWLKNPGSIIPRRQPWWDTSGSLLSWFIDASRAYNLTVSFLCTFTEESHRNFEAVVADWLVLTAKLGAIPGMPGFLDHVRTPGRRITEEQAKHVLEILEQAKSRVDTGVLPRQLPTAAAVMDNMLTSILPPQPRLLGEISQDGTIPPLVVTRQRSRTKSKQKGKGKQ